jgi:NAD(P)-dependent dehydrogenase (short-subunit alcohol dehydrogenase family)
MTPTGRLEGLTALVNGGGRGLGRAIALEFAREGARVVVNDLGTAWDGRGRDSERAQAVVDAIRDFGAEAIADAGDIGDLEDARAMVQKAIDAWGKLDILVNAAGIIRLGTPIDTAPEDWDAIIRVHLRGYFNTTQFAARHWVERGEYGRLINFASGASLVSQPTILAYSAAKTGVVGFTRSCANALAAYNVTANCIRPSAATGMGDELGQARRFREETGQKASEAAVGTARDPVHVAPLVVFLASPAAGHVSGRLLEGRGGRYVLWSEPHEERVVELDFLTEPDRLYAELEETLCADLSLRDLKMPMAPIDELGDWKSEYGVQAPLLDLTSARSTG